MKITIVVITIVSISAPKAVTRNQFCMGFFSNVFIILSTINDKFVACNVVSLCFAEQN